MKAEFLTEAQLEELGIASRRTLQGWRLFGKSPKLYRFGGSVRYRRSDVEAWVESCAVSPIANRK
jgi:predicted DNA-binding transcriptional regulator AlpA